MSGELRREDANGSAAWMPASKMPSPSSSARELLKTLGKDKQEIRSWANDALEFVDLAKEIHNRDDAPKLLEYASDQFEKAIAMMTGPTTSAPSRKQ